MFKDEELPPNVPAVNIHLFSSTVTAASHLNICSLVLSVWFVSWNVYSIGKSLFTGRLRIALVFSILTIAPFISESLPGYTPITMTIFQKCLGTFSS